MKRLLRTQLISRRMLPLIFAVAFAGIGIAFLLTTNAATDGIALEAESVQPTGPASIVQDAAASGGAAIQFEAACPVGQVGTPPNCVTPTPTGMPAQCASGGTYVWSNLEACGWPGPSNTGYPVGTALRTTSTRTITTNNTVIDGEQINGNITINAQNVTIKNSLINYSGSGGGGSGAIKILSGASAIIDHVEIDGKSAVHACVWHEGSSVTISYLKCHDMEDAVFSWAATGNAQSGNSFILEHSYIHTFNAIESNGHFDGYQTEGAANGQIRHNTIDMGPEGNAAVALWNSQKNTDNITVESNLLAGGGFTVYAEDYSPSEATNANPNNPVGGNTMTNIRFLQNSFSTKYNGCVGSYGVWFFRSAWTYQGGPTGGWGANGNVRTGNTILENGQSVDGGNPTNNGTICS